MTFKVKVTHGPCVGDEWYPSRIEAWVARDGQPSEKVQDNQNVYLSAGSPCDGEKTGKFWLEPYHTYKDASEVHPTAYTWYKELIVSTQDIADPGATPPPPSGLKLSQRRRIQ